MIGYLLATPFIIALWAAMIYGVNFLWHIRPKNLLMQKLAEREAEIERLKGVLQRTGRSY